MIHVDPQVTPSPSLDEATRARVQATIERLGLNDEECLAARALYYQPYVEGELSAEQLREWSPFVAQQALDRHDGESGGRVSARPGSSPRRPPG